MKTKTVKGMQNLKGSEVGAFAQKHWICGLLSSGILNNWKTQIFGNWISFRLQVMGRHLKTESDTISVTFSSI
jgi:hypothetical protein